MAKGLQHIHAEGIKHLDLKPANILVKDGVYKIGDFGQSKLGKESIDENFYEAGGNGRYTEFRMPLSGPVRLESLPGFLPEFMNLL